GAVPGTPRPPSSITHSLHGSSGDLDLLELDARKEGDRPAIGRPEGITGAFGAWQRLCREIIECSHPKLILTARCGSTTQPSAIRRNGKRAQARLRGWQNRKLDTPRLRRALAEMAESQRQ